MLKTRISHPELLQALAEAGHGARIVLVDNNYAFTVNVNPAARIVFLNFTAGMINGIDILRALADTIAVESAIYMETADGKMPDVIKEFQTILPGVPFTGKERFAFYDEAKADDVCLLIASGETRPRANLVMTVGVVRD